MLHEIITCDVCNEDGIIDPEDPNEGLSGQFMGSAEAARGLGWDVVEGDPYVEHTCPACIEQGKSEAGAKG